MTPELSVIVPVLNEAKYLETTLQMIVNQNTNVDYELIVSDNGSTDGSMDIAKKYADSVLRCEEIGIGAARHFGALHGNNSSKYLLFVDADTHIPGYYLAYLCETFKADPGLIAFSTGFKFSERTEHVKFAENVANGTILKSSDSPILSTEKKTTDNKSLSINDNYRKINSFLR